MGEKVVAGSTEGVDGGILVHSGELVLAEPSLAEERDEGAHGRLAYLEVEQGAAEMLLGCFGGPAAQSARGQAVEEAGVGGDDGAARIGVGLQVGDRSVEGVAGRLALLVVVDVDSGRGWAAASGRPRRRAQGADHHDAER